MAQPELPARWDPPGMRRSGCSAVPKILRNAWPRQGSHTRTRTHTISPAREFLGCYFHAAGNACGGIKARRTKGKAWTYLYQSFRSGGTAHTAHTQQLIAGSGTATAAIWDKSQDCLPVLQFRASADAGLCLEVAVSLRSSLFPSPRQRLGSPGSSGGMRKGCCGCHRHSWHRWPLRNPPFAGSGGFSGICTGQRSGVHRSHVWSKTGVRANPSNLGVHGQGSSLLKHPRASSQLLTPHDILGGNSSPPTSGSCRSPQ